MCVQSAVVALVYDFQLTVAPCLVDLLRKVEVMDASNDTTSLRIKEAGRWKGGREEPWDFPFLKKNCVPFCYKSNFIRFLRSFCLFVCLFVLGKSCVLQVRWSAMFVCLLQCTQLWDYVPFSCTMSLTTTPGTKPTCSRKSTF